MPPSRPTSRPARPTWRPASCTSPTTGGGGGLPGGYGLYLLPSAKQLTAPSWRRLGELVRAGATVYASYCAGETSAQRGPWWNDLEGLFGVRQLLTYGLNDPVDEDVVELTLEEDFGNPPAGAVLSFAAAGNAEARARLPIEVVDPSRTRVIARDGRGRPALVECRHGRGRTVLCTYPVEYFAARRGRVNPEDTWRLYDALAVEAGVTRPAHVDDPLVMVDSLRTADGAQYTIVLSQHDEPVEVNIDYDDGGAASPCGWSRWAPASSGGRRPIRETAGERPRCGEVNLKVPRVPPSRGPRRRISESVSKTPIEPERRKRIVGIPRLRILPMAGESVAPYDRIDLSQKPTYCHSRGSFCLLD